MDEEDIVSGNTFSDVVVDFIRHLAVASRIDTRDELFLLGRSCFLGPFIVGALEKQ